MNPNGEKRNKRVLIRVTTEPGCVFQEYSPVVGQTYEAEFIPASWQSGRQKYSEFCIVDIRDKRIVLRKDEYELIGG